VTSHAEKKADKLGFLAARVAQAMIWSEMKHWLTDAYPIQYNVISINWRKLKSS
jgi:hypothetical protein